MRRLLSLRHINWTRGNERSKEVEASGSEAEGSVPTYSKPGKSRFHATKPCETCRATFTNLPVEIWQHIVDYLGVEDAVCLSLCTRDTYKYIGKQTRVLGRLIFEDEARYRFLKRLRRDMSPYLVLCESCVLLHNISQSTDGRKCNAQEQDDQCRYYLHSRFSFGAVQIAAELNRRSRFKDLEQHLGSYNVQDYGGHFETFLVDFQVQFHNSDGQVYVRKQEWLPIELTQCATVPNQSFTLEMCKHINDRKFRTMYKTDIDVAEKSVRHLKVLGYLQEVPGIHVSEKLDWAYSTQFNCTQCATEYRIDFGLASSDSTSSNVATARNDKAMQFTRKKELYAIVVTKWICLGNGESRKTGPWSAYCGGHTGVAWGPPAITPFTGFEGHTHVEKYKPVWTPELEGLLKKRTK